MQWSDFLPHLAHLPRHSHANIQKAFDLGSRLHEGQKRKSGEPYFTHPIAVARILADVGADEETVIVALLHDAVEDTPLTIDEVGQQFGPSVQRLIDGLTKLLVHELTNKPTINEQVETLRKMFTIMQADIRVMVIKLADRLHNMQTVSFLSEERRREMAAETLDFYVKIANKLCMLDLEEELHGLCLQVLEPELYEQLSPLRSRLSSETPDIVRRMRHRIGEEHLAHIRMEPEQQIWKRLRQILETQGMAVTGRTSYLVSFVCPSIDACYSLLGTLHQRWPREIFSFQDYINTPVINGYRGLHTALILEDGTRVRCKIRTEEMQSYAHKGIATYCFDKKAQGFLDYLPWTQKIAPLAQDTKDRSQEFWESLQTDVLGDAILLYDKHGNSTSVPAGSTALDAAFYFADNRSLCLEKIVRNGKEIAFHTPVDLGDSLVFTFAEQTTVQRDWLNWVSTSFAAATIRAGLSELQSEEEKLRVGKQMLQQALNEGKKGYIEEFHEEQLVQGLREIGYDNLQEAYIAIADGHLDPLDAYIALFDVNKNNRQQKRFCTITFFTTLLEPELLSYLETLPQNRDSFREMRFSYKPALHGTKVVIRMYLSPQEQNAVFSELRLRGATQVQIRSKHTRLHATIGVVAILLLWNLDPVFAKYLLQPPVAANPIDFAIMRQVGFFLVSVLHLFNPFFPVPFAYHKLPKTNNLLVASGIAFAVVGLTTYLSLEGLLPQDYITIVNASAVLIPMLSPFEHVFQNRRISGLSLLITVIALLLVKALRPDMPMINYVMGLLLLVSFSVFTICINEYRRRYSVSARLPSLLFLISIISLLCTLPLVFTSTLITAPITHTFALLLYGIVMVGIPYHLYYHLIFTRWIKNLGVYFPFGVALTLLGQLFIFGSIHLFSLIPFLLVVFAATLFLRRSGPAVTGNVG